MPTTITFDTQTVTILNNEPPIQIHVDAVPPLYITQVPGVGAPGPTGATGLTGPIGPPGHAQLALSIPGPLLVAVGTMPFVSARAMTVVGIRVAVGVAPVGSDIVFDVLLNGATMFTTVGNRPRILDGATESAALAVPDVTAVPAGGLITVNVVQIGAVTAGSNGVLVVDSI